jgi:putative membrane protein
MGPPAGFSGSQLPRFSPPNASGGTEPRRRIGRFRGTTEVAARLEGDFVRAGSREPLVLLLLGLVLLVWSGIAPKDRFTWFLEVLPVLVGVPILVATHRRFPLTPLLYRLLLIHAAILMAGGHWTYAEVPLGFWMKETFHFARNHYDRIGHLAQGFVPAILAREILLRKTPLRARGWLFTLVTAVCLAVSALYELFEWGTAVATGSAADAFLGTQGDPWDTQWDMFLCLAGALVSQLLLSRTHDRELAKLGSRSPASLR